MGRIRFGRPTPAMVVAIIALFVALGGTGYAALNLPPHSVGKKELKRNAVTTAKVDNGTLRLKDFYRRDLNRLLRRAAAGGEEFEDFEDFEDFDDPIADDDGGGDAGGSAESAALLTGAAGGLPDSGEPAERALAQRHRQRGPKRDASGDAVAGSRAEPERPRRRAWRSDVPAGASVAVEVVTRTLGAPAETVVLGCTVAGSGPGRPDVHGGGAGDAARPTSSSTCGSRSPAVARTSTAATGA